MLNKKLNTRVIFDVGLIFVVGFAVRIFIINFLNYNIDYRSGDSGYYLDVAYNILNSGVHGTGSPAEPTFFRAPLYSLFAAGILSIFGENALTFFVVQSVLSMVLGGAIYFMLSPHKPTLAFIAALMIVASPSDIFFNGRVLGETLVAFFLVLGVVQLYIAKSSIQYFIAGLLFALASLVRDVYVLLPFFIIFYIILFRRERAKFSVFLLAGLLFGIGPWVLRNAIQEDGGLFISKGASGYNLWVGTWERDPQWTIDQKFPTYAFNSDEERKTVKYAASDNDDKYMQHLALTRLSDDLSGVIATWIKRAPRLWIGTRSDLVTFTYKRYSQEWYLIKYSLFVLNIVILISAFLGVLLAIKKRESLGILVIPLIYTSFIYLPFHSTETRYSQPVYPLLLIFVAYFFIEIFMRFKPKRIEFLNVRVETI